MDDQMIRILAVKLGISSRQVLLKAEEIKRLIDVRARTSTLNITGTAEVVICLDLATESLNLPFNKDLAVRLSGIRKKSYTSSVQMYAKFLGCSNSNSVSIEDIAQQLGCSQIVEAAQSLLHRYKEANNARLSGTGSEDFDFSHAKFAAAAVYITARKLKVKIGKKRTVEAGKVGQVLFDKLCEDMANYLTISAETKSTRKESKGSKSLIDFIQEKMDVPVKRKRSSDDEDDTGYNYQEWKKKILSEDV
ncbi:Origin of replication complex subunit 6 [Chamberlinius hualienensis]